MSLTHPVNMRLASGSAAYTLECIYSERKHTECILTDCIHTDCVPVNTPVHGADLTVADRNFAMRSCKTGVFKTSLTVGRRFGSVRSVMSTNSFSPLE